MALHLGLMVGVPLLAAAWRRLGQRSPSEGGWLPSLLLAVGALLMASAGATLWRVAGMVLLVLAWSWTTLGLPVARSGAVHVPVGLGPALLLAVGLLAPTQGPAAMQAVWGPGCGAGPAGLCAMAPSVALPAPGNPALERRLMNGLEIGLIHNVLDFGARV